MAAMDEPDSVQPDGGTPTDEPTSDGRGLTVPYLDDVVAVLIILFYLGLVVAVMLGALQWSKLPASLQYWTTSAFILALGLIFGKGVVKFRRKR